MNLKERLQQIQDKARKAQEEEKETLKKEDAAKIEADRKRMLKLADDEFPKYVIKLEEAARESPNSKELTIKSSRGCQIFAQRLAELFTGKGMKCEVQVYVIEDYYARGCTAEFYDLKFQL
jgi:hypothetical protein